MNCYKCKYRGNVPGDAHSRCTHPEVADTGDGSMFDAIVVMISSPETIQHAADRLNIQANPHGIRNGWFMWPVNFDPAWLENCDGFVEKEK